MLEITFDAGNVQSVLTALADARNAALMTKVMAETFVEDTKDWIAAGRSFTPRTGQLEHAITWRPIGNDAEVLVNADYAGFVEFGTRPHVIEPKPGRKGLKVLTGDGGGYVIRRKVNHPGSRPYPFFFADLDARKQHMQEQVMSVLMSRLAHG